MKLTPDQIRKLQSYFAEQKDIMCVYLYGSYTKGTDHKGSDIDFGILFDSPIKTYSRLGEIINDLIDLELPAEPDVRNISLDNSPVYLMNVIKGQSIYTKDIIKKVEFEVQVMNTFNDSEYLRQLKFNYLDKHFKEGTYGHRLLGN